MLDERRYSLRSNAQRSYYDHSQSNCLGVCAVTELEFFLWETKAWKFFLSFNNKKYTKIQN